MNEIEQDFIERAELNAFLEDRCPPEYHETLDLDMAHIDGYWDAVAIWGEGVIASDYDRDLLARRTAFIACDIPW